MQNVELAIFLIVLLAAAVALLGHRPWNNWRLGLLAIPLVGLGAAVFWTAPNQAIEELKQEVPHLGKVTYSGSSACLACHPSEYHSWHASYHRTMTQLATPEAVLAPFDGRTLLTGGFEHKVERQGPWFVVETIDPDWDAARQSGSVTLESGQEPPRARLPVVMTTGSHHLQTYWIPSEHGNKVRLFSWVYHIDSKRWIRNQDSFILPPGNEHHNQVWNNSCIVCHSVAGETGYDPGNWQSRVAELGIACESCHGPAEEHIKHYNNPLNRYVSRLSQSKVETIVNPAKLAHEKSSEICGQCHTAFDDEAELAYTQYRPGGDYQAAYKLADPHNPQDQRFWSDGTMRVGGREFSGMIESACYLEGEMSCLSCHSLHQGPPNKQLNPQLTLNQQCTQCHQQIEQNISEHTHHSAESSGSQCVNCHMPYTSYALFSAVRSHRIDSPSAQVSIESGRPNACNQCHLDQSLAWTAKHLHQWYGTPIPEASEQYQIPASIQWALSGNAVQRALAAWSMGWESALQASGKDWQPRILIELLDDPYSIVRQLAANSLANLDVEIPEFDAMKSTRDRQPVAVDLRNRWNQLDTTNHPGLPSVQSTTTGPQWNTQLLQQLLQARDDQEVTLVE
jgi:predicted CXXCH cytochrome family protein